ncbi:MULTISPECIES: XdhC family protein [unclassified Polaromonas]|jgi:xanthine dehydrogenase accessory factor|uniref:XdhC family protein n=1 Tax=unclassified Polaromonas TaxID=2638319 RepID=UPI000BC40025|nr:MULTISPECIES: XdhC family protein [unclassified Polaromonas]OYY35258.1 MAG: cytochrome oxidase I [Polaromonas sp. 35-63-35]OYZ19138.1 MAG: cytochrome oxidase I [Polaromonas sp. 16-63-31]OYZ78237.1 MAG: cytochrome oxidase I [Polaromonas sp. 24-63-21]OZA48795.1 MAG: cytochrome oxidase I [Polaromonas sp. 17-63-33]OZA87682.1 MAG: cytochrome oxidase I [Polaromonas sp. 39-63-25]
MENLDVMVLRTLRDWRMAGKRALLATVVRTWGSSPRPVGSIMALCEDGAVVGSVSGGCIEDDLIYRHTQAYASTSASAPAQGGGNTIPSGPPTFVKYGITADEAHRFGLPCGGTLELLLEYDPDAAALAQLVQALEAGQLMQRTVRLTDGAVTLVTARAPAELSVSSVELVNTFGPEYRMLLIGAGQLTEYLATMALFSGFAVTVCDPREEYRSAWSVAGAKVLSDMPDDVVVAFKPDRRSCVIALTHDPKLDDLALLEALATDAFYVGAIGSRRNNDARHQRMAEHFGLNEAALARLRGPIGIYIGSKTPPEIAVSVMAEVLAVKNGVVLPRDMEVAQAKNERAVLANEPGDLVCGVARSS